MPPQRGRLPSIFSTSPEDMAKKDDDRKPPAVTSWAPARIARRRSARRLVPLVLLFAIVYSTYTLLRPSPQLRDLVPDFPTYENPGPAHFDRVWHSSQPRPQSPLKPQPPSTPKQTEDGQTGERAGPAATRSAQASVTLPALPSTLVEIEDTEEGEENRNVLFASSSLRSVAALLPLACEMGRQGRNVVHFAVMSRNDMPIQELASINGIDDSCAINFHDARPDYASESTDARVRAATERALYYLNFYMQPQAIIVDGSDTENPSFLAAMRYQADHSTQSVIELPGNGAERFGWLARLTSSSLAAWNMVDLEIVVHAPPTGSGGLIRLLRSLAGADFSPFPTPRLTIELPQHVEQPTEKFLRDFSWPAREEESQPRLQMLSLRRRLSHQDMDEDASVARFLESAWPKVPETSHILVLSPNAELSAQFPHYLKYALLEYMYSANSTLKGWGERLVGINLDLPTTHLDALQAFIPPATPEVRSPAFLWQAPSSNALLVTGSKWTELHDFVSRTLPLRALTPAPSIITEKVASTAHPAWLERLLQLCRLRGYLTLYPGLETAATLATSHEDLAQGPEEYRASGSPRAKRRKEVVLGESGVDTLHTLPRDGELMPLEEMPVLGWQGDETNIVEVEEGARGYREEFRAAVGCEGEGDALFC